MLHLGDFGGDITILKAFRVFTVSSELSYAIIERPRPEQVAVLEDERGVPTLIRLADTEADATSWLKAHHHPKARIAPADVSQPRTFTYLRDPDHGWLIVTRADLHVAGMSSDDFTACSYVLEHLFALEEDADMPRFLKRLDERGIAYRLHEHHMKGDAYCPLLGTELTPPGRGRLICLQDRSPQRWPGSRKLPGRASAPTVISRAASVARLL